MISGFVCTCESKEATKWSLTVFWDPISHPVLFQISHSLKHPFKKRTLRRLRPHELLAPNFERLKIGLVLEHYTHYIRRCNITRLIWKKGFTCKIWAKCKLHVTDMISPPVCDFLFLCIIRNLFFSIHSNNIINCCFSNSLHKYTGFAANLYWIRGASWPTLNVTTFNCS